MKIEAEVLKDLYKATYNKLRASPVYTQTVLDLKADIATKIANDVKGLITKDVKKFIIGGNLEQFRTDYGETILPNVTHLAMVAREEEIKDSETKNKEIHRTDWLDKTTKYIYLMAKLEAIEASLITFGVKPVIENETVKFILINK